MRAMVGKGHCRLLSGPGHLPSPIIGGQNEKVDWPIEGGNVHRKTRVDFDGPRNGHIWPKQGRGEGARGNRHRKGEQIGDDGGEETKRPKGGCNDRRGRRMEKGQQKLVGGIIQREKGNLKHRRINWPGKWTFWDIFWTGMDGP
jgi:hypothetical protein